MGDLARSRTDWSRTLLHACCGLLVVAACWAAFAESLAYDFVAGDIEFIVDSEAIKQPTVLRTAFAEDYWYDEGLAGGASGSSYYRPLVVLTNALDFRWYGLDPSGFHLTNILLHLLVTGLVYLLALRVGRRRGVAWLAALLFALHPIHTHAVTYVSGRTSVLVAAFYVGSLLLWLRRHDRAERSGARFVYGLLAVLAFGAALLAKETAATLPLTGAALWMLTGRGARGAAWRQHGPMLGALLAVLSTYAAVRYAVLGAVLSNRSSPWDELGFLPAVLTIGKTYVWYGEKLIWPTGLSYLPPFVPATGSGDVAGWSSAVLLAATALLAWRAPRTFRQEKLWLAWWVVTLLPVSGVVPLEYPVKEHYAYLPSVGFCILAATLAARVHQRLGEHLRPSLQRVVSAAAVVTAAVVYLTLTAAHNRTWQSTTTMYERIVELEGQISDEAFRHPAMADSAYRYAVTRFNLAQQRAQAGRCREALVHYARAAQLTPAPHMKQQIRYYAAECHFELGEYEAARRHFAAVVDSFPDDPRPALRLAWMAQHAGQPVEARRWLTLGCQRGAAVACRLLETGP